MRIEWRLRWRSNDEAIRVVMSEKVKDGSHRGGKMERKLI